MHNAIKGEQRYYTCSSVEHTVASRKAAAAVAADGGVGGGLKRYRLDERERRRCAY